MFSGRQDILRLMARRLDVGEILRRADTRGAIRHGATACGVHPHGNAWRVALRGLAVPRVTFRVTLRAMIRTFAIKVMFRFEAGDALAVDYLDYH